MGFLGIICCIFHIIYTTIKSPKLFYIKIYLLFIKIKFKKITLIRDLDTWRSKFQTYQLFKDQLNNAIQLHQPFDVFVKREIIGNIEIDKIIRLSNWKKFLQNFKSVKDLKDIYRIHIYKTK